MIFHSEKVMILALIFASTVLLISIVILLFLFLRAQQKRNQYSLELEQSRIYTEQFRDYKKRYAVLQDQRHDMKHHISYIKELMQREEYDKMQEYIDAVMKELR